MTYTDLYKKAAVAQSAVQTPAYKFKDWNPDVYPSSVVQFGNAVKHAETGSFKDPYIRTTVRPAGGSTAYGPYQLTKTKAADYFNRFPAEMAPYKNFYDTTLSPMYDKFKQYGNAPQKEGYNAKWDYGGAGDPLTDAQKEQYEKMALTMMKIDQQQAMKAFPNDPEKQRMLQLKMWRGTDSDQAYNQKFNTFYNQHKPK